MRQPLSNASRMDHANRNQYMTSGSGNTENKLIAAYGTLRVGFYNYGRMGRQKLLGNITQRGLMFLAPMASYPYLFKEGATQHSDDLSREHTLEIFEVEPETYEGIVYMEKGAGYKPETIKTPWGDATIFWADPAQVSAKANRHINEFSLSEIERITA